MEPYLTIDDIKKMLNVSRQAILNLITSGELRAVKVGRLWRITPQALNRYLETIGALDSDPDPVTVTLPDFGPLYEPESVSVTE